MKFKNSFSLTTDHDSTRTVTVSACRTDGGDKLSYLLVEYFNEILLDTFKKMKKNCLFDFLHQESQFQSSQAETNGNLEHFIEEIKKNITARYKINLKKDQSPFIIQIVESISKGMGIHDNRSKRKLFNEFVLPGQLPGPLIGFLLNFFPGGIFYKKRMLLRLKKQVIGYIKGNVKELFNEISIQSGFHRCSLKNTDLFCLVRKRCQAKFSLQNHLLLKRFDLSKPVYQKKEFQYSE
jgi:hypothetical protein